MDKRNDIEKCIISEAEKEEFSKRIMDWLSDENLEKARGKTRWEIFNEFDSVTPYPIAYIPEKYMVVFDEGIKDNRVYSSQAYFVDHAVNNHPDIIKGKYLLIQEVLDDPDEIKEILRKRFQLHLSKKSTDIMPLSFSWKNQQRGKLFGTSRFLTKIKSRMPVKNTKEYGLNHRRAAFPPSSMPILRHTAAAFLLVTTVQK